MHVDVKKLGNIPDGAGWRYVGRKQGDRNRASTPDKPRNHYGGPKLGYASVHTVLDDHSRVAYTEVHDDENAVTAVGVLHRAVDLVRAAWRHHRAGAVGQRRRLPVLLVARHVRDAVDPAQAHTPVPATNEWEGRALPPDCG